MNIYMCYIIYCIMVVVLASGVTSVRIPGELKKRLTRIRSRLTGKLDPATIAKLVRDDRSRS